MLWVEKSDKFANFKLFNSLARHQIPVWNIDQREKHRIVSNNMNNNDSGECSHNFVRTLLVEAEPKVGPSTVILIYKHSNFLQAVCKLQIFINPTQTSKVQQ